MDERRRALTGQGFRADCKERDLNAISLGQQDRLIVMDCVLGCPDARVQSGECVPIGLVGLGCLLALRSSRRELIHAGSVHRKSLLDQERRRRRVGEGRALALALPS